MYKFSSSKYRWRSAVVLRLIAGVQSLGAEMQKKSLLAALALAASLGAMGGASAQERVRIGLPVPNYGPYTPIYAADELGFFKKNGIAIEITSYRGSAALQEAMVAGYVDVQVTSPNRAVLAISKGAKQLMVGAMTTAPTGWHIVVPTNSPIKTVADLGGKKVGVTSAGGLTHLYLDWATRGISTKAMAIPVGASGLIPTLKSKQVDAASVHSPLAASMIATGEARSIFNVARDMPPHMPDAWVATIQMIDAKPKVVENTLRSVYQAVVYLKENRSKAIELLRKHTGEKDEGVLAAEYEAIRDLPVSARVEIKWIEDALSLANIKPGTGGIPELKDLFTDKFAAASAQ